MNAAIEPQAKRRRPRKKPVTSSCVLTPTATGEGMTKHELYSTWHSMMARCYDPENARYASYGGRGIAVYEPWHSAKTFIEAIPPRPNKGMQLDRIDNNGNYEPGNVRWATRKGNIRNRAVTVRLEFKGEIKPLAEIAEILGIKKATLEARMYRGDPDLFRPAAKARGRTGNKPKDTTDTTKGQA